MLKHLYKITILSLLLPLLALADGREMLYYCDIDGMISCVNGKNRYTRALYGPNTLWRLETSDMPIFAAYHKKDNRNIHFTAKTGDLTLRLDSVEYCYAMYSRGNRYYILKDSRWGNEANLEITVWTIPGQEAALWSIQATEFDTPVTVTANCCATSGVKMSRSGDIGIDPRECFDPHPSLKDLQQCTVTLKGNDSRQAYIKYADRAVTADNQQTLADLYQTSRIENNKKSARLSIRTPDPYISRIGWILTAAGDAIWDGTSYQHGAVGWRMPLSGWRGAYTGDFLGWHDRARKHFDSYALSQVTEVEPIYGHPAQDIFSNLARAEKRWGTPMYSNGYICRNPGRKDQMHHYDMNLCYIDELLWHLKWTGDLDYARKMWPVITRSLQWEKRNYDPDNDGLYDAYCCIWASDALYYNSGAVTHSTAYNYRANRVAAEIAEAIGENPEPYRQEADKIYKAAQKSLWLDDKGVWAEYRDFMGYGLTHDHPGIWTIYHAVDSDLGTPLQAYLATDYVTNNIPHIPVVPTGAYADQRKLNNDVDLATISTTDWMPYSWSINNVAFAEVYNMSLAYWQAGRKNEAYRLLLSAVTDGMYMGQSPGNIGQVSQYDAARGECYRDFADGVGVLSRAVVQGLFGVSPDLLHRRVEIRPGWPTDWSYADIKHPDFKLSYDREGMTDTYTIYLGLETADSIDLVVEAQRDKVNAVRLNGEPVAWAVDTESVGTPRIRISAPRSQMAPMDDGIGNEYMWSVDQIVIDWGGAEIVKCNPTEPYATETQHRLRQGDMTWILPTLRPHAINRTYTDAQLGVSPAKGRYEPIALDASYNANVTDIFRNRYVSPRSPYTTLQIPMQGIGEWCHPTDTAHIDDAKLRSAAGMVTVADVPFSTPAQGHNVVYTSLFDNYPTAVEIPLSGSASAINLLLAGSTNHMQCYVENARITATYADGTTTALPLIAPHNWCPIEQDLYVDGKAFRLPNTRPIRYTLKDGVYSSDLGAVLGIDEVYGRRIDGGAATMLSIALDPDKELKSLRLETIANDIVVGIIASTYVK